MININQLSDVELAETAAQRLNIGRPDSPYIEDETHYNKVLDKQLNRLKVEMDCCEFLKLIDDGPALSEFINWFSDGLVSDGRMTQAQCSQYPYSGEYSND